MKRRLPFALLAAAAAALAAPLAGAPEAAQAQAQRDWSRTIVATPEGGFRMGNPAAPVKVVEFVSLTCPTCARFSNGAKAPLAAKVRTGKVSFEFRNYVLNSIDLTAALLARCAGPSRFFPFTEHLFATQPQWVGKITGMSQAQKDEIQKLPSDQQIARVAELGGLLRMASAAGVNPQRAGACLSDKAGIDRLVQMRAAGDAAGINHTPSFLINGKPVEGHDWAGIEPLIRKAGG